MSKLLLISNGKLGLIINFLIVPVIISVCYSDNGKEGVKYIAYNITHPKFGSIHAEHACLKKYNSKGKCLKRRIHKSLLVIKLKKDNTLGLSKPCNKCIRNINIISTQKGIYIKKIYYSNGNNNITCEKFVDLFYDKNKHITNFERFKSKYNKKLFS